MHDGVKETPCTYCVHRQVCSYKDDFLAVIDAVNRADVHRSTADGKMTSKRVTLFDFVSDISVSCRYHQKEVATPRDGIF